MRSNSQNKGSGITTKALRGKQKRGGRPYKEIDLDAWIAKLVSTDDNVRETYERDVTIRELVLNLILSRENSGLSQKQLAEKIGVSQQMVSKLEHIDYEGRTFALLWRHLDALGYRPVVKFESIEKWRKKHPIPGLKE